MTAPTDKPSHHATMRTRSALPMPDVRSPAFAAEAARQAALLRSAPEELEALRFIEAVVDTTGWR